MKNRKTSRIKISMDCFICLNIEDRPGVSRYYSQKNKKNTSYKLALRKYCKFCHNHKSHNENK